ncbi:adenylyl-sulfate reductase [Candidatus Pelagibacter sp.]|nr:adenylyl-sulfate reductase [Candidatus Pelagibacter sp.]
MFTINPFATLAETIPSIVLQSFVFVMVALVIVGTLVDVVHKKNVKYFFDNAKKAKLSAKKKLTNGERASVVIKTVVHDIATTAELGAGKRRVAHILGMYGTILFWIASVIMIFCYTSTDSVTPKVWPIIWHIGAIMTCVGGYWFWLFLRVDVLSEAYPWYRIIKADLFVLALLACSTFGLAWSYIQSLNLDNRWDDKVFLVFYILSNIILFGGVYWSKFAHMFYKPGAAIQKNLAEADGSRDNLPPPADAEEQFGLGIKREAPKHY